MELRDFLVGLVSSGILGTLAYPLVNWLEIKWAWLHTSEPWVRRLASWIAAVSIGALPYLAQVVLLYEPAPADWRAWVERLFSVGFVAVTAAQGVHILKRKPVEAVVY